MHRFVAALVLLGGIGMTVASADAAGGCGRGYHWNGWRCAPDHRHYVPRYYTPPTASFYAPARTHRSRGCPPHYGWSPRYGKCTLNFD